MLQVYSMEHAALTSRVDPIEHGASSVDPIDHGGLDSPVDPFKSGACASSTFDPSARGALDIQSQDLSPNIYAAP